jgi:hypothetical protein
LAAVVDGSGNAESVVWQRAKVSHDAILPKERVQLAVGSSGAADHLCVLIDGNGEGRRAAKGSEVGHGITIPKNRSKRWAPGFCGIAHDLPAIVDVPSFAEEQPGESPEVSYSFITIPKKCVGFPGDDAGFPDHFAATVETTAYAARPAKCAEVGDRVGYVLVLRQGPSLGKNKSAECNEQPYSFHGFPLCLVCLFAIRRRTARQEDQFQWHHSRILERD